MILLRASEACFLILICLILFSILIVRGKPNKRFGVTSKKTIRCEKRKSHERNAKHNRFNRCKAKRDCRERANRELLSVGHIDLIFNAALVDVAVTPSH
jgi:hypothetical protein